MDIFFRIDNTKKMDLPDDVILELMLNLNYPEIIRFCRTNSGIYQLCQNEYFWYRKVQKDFDVAQYKPIGMTYQEQYQSLYNLPFYYDAINNGRLDQLILLKKRGWNPSLADFYLAALREQILVLDWFWNLGIVPDNQIIMSVGPYSVPFLNWLESHGITVGVDLANLSKKIEVLFWLESRGIFPNVDGANRAAEEGRRDLLNWMASRGIFPDQEGLVRASSGHNLDIVRWIVSLGVQPNQHAANTAAEHGQIDLLDYYESLGIVPDRRSADAAILADSLNSLDWLAKRGILPTQRGIFDAINEGNLDLLKWIVSHGLEPQVSWANQAHRRGIRHVLDWLAKYGIFPKKR